MIIIMEGPDGVGKTNIGQAFARSLDMNYFKATTEHKNWRQNSFKNALEFDQVYISDFLQQVPCDVVIDRAYPSEYVYSHVFKRETNIELIKEIDKKFASLGTTVLILLRRDYSKVTDELVENNKLDALHHMYWAFYSETKCNCIVMYVDDFNDDLQEQLPKLEEALNVILVSDSPRKIIITKEVDDAEVSEETT